MASYQTKIRLAFNLTDFLFLPTFIPQNYFPNRTL